jgi:sulfate permease, SulP family
VLLTLLLVLVELDRVGLTELQPTHDGQDLQAAGAHAQPVPGLLILRFDGPLYTANVRSANRKIIASVDRHPGTEVLVLDATALAQLTITVIEEFAELERELGDRGVSVWMAAVPPNALLTAGQTLRWAELDQADRLYPTALTAVHAFRGRCPGAVPAGRVLLRWPAGHHVRRHLPRPGHGAGQPAH